MTWRLIFRAIWMTIITSVFGTDYSASQTFPCVSEFAQVEWVLRLQDGGTVVKYTRPVPVQVWASEEAYVAGFFMIPDRLDIMRRLFNRCSGIPLILTSTTFSEVASAAKWRSSWMWLQKICHLGLGWTTVFQITFTCLTRLYDRVHTCFTLALLGAYWVFIGCLGTCFALYFHTFLLCAQKSAVVGYWY